MRTAILLWSLLVAAPVIAQQPVDQSLDEEGRALFAAGRAAFGAERFEDALGHFQAAFDRSQRPELLYNVALALDRSGWPEMVGSIGGDDTIFVASGSAAAQKTLIAKIERARAP